MRQEIPFPRQINKVSEMSQGLIRKMLKARPQDRISWEELFNHPINDYLAKEMEKQMSLTLTMDGNISENISKLYLNQNLVIIHTNDFKKN